MSGGGLGEFSLSSASWAALKSEIVANMAATWLPKRSPNREKIDAKIDQKIDASWGRFLEDFCGFGEAKWRHVGLQNRTKADVIFKKRFFEKTLFFHWKNSDFQGSEG